MPKYPFQVDVPKDGPLTREQGWAALDRLKTQMDQILRRMNAEQQYLGSEGLKPHDDCVLPAEELEEALNVKLRFRRLIESLGKDVLDRLADIRDEDDDWDPWGLRKFPPELRFLLDDRTSDLERYTRGKDGACAEVAFALLEQEDWSPAEIGELIEKRFSPGRKGSCWWACPLCDEWEPGYIDKEECKRCYGWGFIRTEEEPDYESFPQSRKGRAALSNGQSWTDEQEKEAWAEENDED